MSAPEKWGKLSGAEYFIGIAAVSMAAGIREDEMAKRLSELPLEYIGAVPIIRKSEMARILESGHWNRHRAWAA
jgi:hypothetical protein